VSTAFPKIYLELIHKMFPDDAPFLFYGDKMAFETAQSHTANCGESTHTPAGWHFAEKPEENRIGQT
jgi:hypothetical protein